MKQVDARGQLCPQPVVMTKSALAEQPDVIQVIVDNPIAGQNVSRFLNNQGYKVKLFAEGMDIIIEGQSDHAPVVQNTPDPTVTPSKVGTTKALFITRNVVGGDDAQLGEILIKGLLSTVIQLDDTERPQVIALMNEGVKLAIQGTSTADTLADFTRAGGQLLVCGTCLKHFGLTEQLEAGTVSNMYEILAELLNHSTVSI